MGPNLFAGAALTAFGGGSVALLEKFSRSLLGFSCRTGRLQLHKAGNPTESECDRYCAGQLSG